MNFSKPPGFQKLRKRRPGITFFLGTFLPFFRAVESPIGIARTSASVSTLGIIFGICLVHFNIASIGAIIQNTFDPAPRLSGSTTSPPPVTRLPDSDYRVFGIAKNVGRTGRRGLAWSRQATAMSSSPASSAPAPLKLCQRSLAAPAASLLGIQFPNGLADDLDECAHCVGLRHPSQRFGRFGTRVRIRCLMRRRKDTANSVGRKQL